MGILDDAIKEHLELKRRRGADPTEVEREEREALGPVRRMAEEAPGAEIASTLPTEARYVDDDAPRPEVFDDEAHFEGQAFEDEDVFEEEDTAPHNVVAPSELAEPGDSAPGSDAAQSAAYAEPVSPGYEEEDGPETAEYDVEAEHQEAEEEEEAEHQEAEAGEEEKSDDMLQETPEFLQDAPEHDRLWFEQRPPRDFDFDG